MLTSPNLSGLFTQRFLSNTLPIPPTNQFSMGSLAPPFELMDAKAKRKVRLSDYAGSRKPSEEAWNRPVLLYFTRIFTEKHYCPLCYPHIQALNENYEQFTQRGAEVLMFTSTDERQSAEVVEHLGLKMPLLIDPSCRIFRRYQVGQALGAPLPAQFLVDPAGKVRFRHLFSFLEPNASIDRLLIALDRIKGVGVAS